MPASGYSPAGMSKAGRRLWSVCVCTLIVLLSASYAQAGFVLSPAVNLNGAASSSDSYLAKVFAHFAEHGQVPGDFLDTDTTRPFSGTGGPGVTFSSASSAMVNFFCPVAAPDLVARIVGDRRLCIPRPPTSDLLRPPRCA